MSRTGTGIDPVQWRPSDVAAFIRSLNPPNFDTYASAFERDSVDGPTLLMIYRMTGSFQTFPTHSTATESNVKSKNSKLV